MLLRRRPILGLLLVIAVLAVLAGCASPEAVENVKPLPDPELRVEYAIAIHGGAGVIERDRDPGEIAEYEAALRAALEVGKRILASGGTSLDATEQTVRFLEDQPLFNAGKGAVFTSEGTHELDAAIMDGENLGCGAVSGVKTVKNPISLARGVMDRSRHVFLMGTGAEHFAEELGMEPVTQGYFSTQKRYDQWQRKVESEKSGAAPTPGKSTVGAVALDRHGNLAAATSTGGLTNKRYGRVGDVPIIGAGTYASNRTCAVSCTGTGEEFIRNTAARDVAALMEYRGLTVAEAARVVIHERLQPGDGGLIAVSHDGSIALEYSSEGMFRACTDSSGKTEIKIWE